MTSAGRERLLITGASRGIGRATAEALARPGRTLLLHGRDRAALDDVAGLVRSCGATARTLVADLADAEQVTALCRRAGKDPLHAMVLCAGSALVEPLGAIGLADWQRALAVGVTAPFLLVREMLPALAAGSSIVLVLSVAARRGFANWSAYCAVKAGLDGFARAVREELRPRGVRVISVFPTATATALWDGVEGDWPRDRMLRPEQVAEVIRFALDRPAEVVLDEIHMGHVSGTL